MASIEFSTPIDSACKLPLSLFSKIVETTYYKNTKKTKEDSLKMVSVIIDGINAVIKGLSAIAKRK